MTCGILQHDDTILIVGKTHHGSMTTRSQNGRNTGATVPVISTRRISCLWASITELSMISTGRIPQHGSLKAGFTMISTTQPLKRSGKRTSHLGSRSSALTPMDGGHIPTKRVLSFRLIQRLLPCLWLKPRGSQWTTDKSISSGWGSAST